MNRPMKIRMRDLNVKKEIKIRMKDEIDIILICVEAEVCCNILC